MLYWLFSKSFAKNVLRMMGSGIPLYLDGTHKKPLSRFYLLLPRGILVLSTIFLTYILLCPVHAPFIAGVLALIDMYIYLLVRLIVYQEHGRLLAAVGGNVDRYGGDHWSSVL